VLRPLLSVIVALPSPTAAVQAAQSFCIAEEGGEPSSSGPSESPEENLEAVPGDRRRFGLITTAAIVLPDRGIALRYRLRAISLAWHTVLPGSEHAFRNGLGTALRC